MNSDMESGTPIEYIREAQQRHMRTRQQNFDNEQEAILMQGQHTTTPSMDAVVRDINNSIDGAQIENERTVVNNISNKNNKMSLIDKIPEVLRDPIIIIILYIILSTDVVKKTLATYIPQIRTTSDGGVLFIGVLIYSIILGVSFAVVKKVIR